LGFWVLVFSGAALREYQQTKKLFADQQRLGAGHLGQKDVEEGGEDNDEDEDDEGDDEVDSEEDEQERADRKERKRRLKAESEAANRIIFDERDPKEIIKECVATYTARIFPGVFSHNTNRLNKLEYEVEHNHSYLSLFMSRKIGARRWVTALRLLTNLSVAVVLLAFLFDLVCKGVCVCVCVHCVLFVFVTKSSRYLTCTHTPHTLTHTHAHTQTHTHTRIHTKAFPVERWKLLQAAYTCGVQRASFDFGRNQALLQVAASSRFSRW